MGEGTKVEVEAVYERDSKRYHLYRIGENDAGIVGSLYLSQDESVPTEVLVRLSVKAVPEED